MKKLSHWMDRGGMIVVYKGLYDLLDVVVSGMPSSRWLTPDGYPLKLKKGGMMLDLGKVAFSLQT